MIASNESDIKECFLLAIELARTIDNMDIDPEIGTAVAQYYLKNPELGKVLFIRHKPSKVIVGFMVLNFQYSLKRDEIMCRGVSFIIKKEYRGRDSPTSSG